MESAHCSMRCDFADAGAALGDSRRLTHESVVQGDPCLDPRPRPRRLPDPGRRSVTATREAEARTEDRPEGGARGGRLARRRSGQGHVGRRHYRVPPRQRPHRAALPGPDQAHDHGQRHVQGGLAQRELRRDRNGAPPRAHALQGHAQPQEHPPGADRARREAQRIHLVRPDQLLRDVSVERGEPQVGARSRGRPDGELVRRQEGPRHRDDGRPQRVRDGRKRSGRHPGGARPLDGVPLAQLRQVDDRSEVGPRARPHRAAAGVLPHVLPARQRRAPRRRPLRRGEDARPRQPDLRQDPEADAPDPDLLHPRSHAGRRALRHAAARRRRPGDRRRVPRAVGDGPLRRRGQPPRAGPDRHAVGPSLQGARRDEEGDVGRRLLHGAARSRVPDVQRGGAAGPERPGREGGAGQDAGRRRGSRAGHEGGGRPRPRDDPEERRPHAQQRGPGRPESLRVHRTGRLAALLPDARPRPVGHRRGRAEGGRGVPEALQPHDRRVPSDAQTRPLRDPAARARGGRRQGLQGRRGDRGGRGVRFLARQHRIAHEALHARQRRPGRAAVEEDPRRDRRHDDHPAVRRREEPGRQVHGGGPGGGHAHARNQPSTRASRSRTSSIA